MKFVLLLSLFFCDEIDFGFIDTILRLYGDVRFSRFVLYLVIRIAFTKTSFSLFIVFLIFGRLDCSFLCDRKGNIDGDMDTSLLFFLTGFTF